MAKLILIHESVSDRHCEVEVTGSVILVRDLGSVNGTWIDTVQIDEAQLGSGQTLQVGDIQFALQMPVRVGVRASGSESAPAGESRRSVAAALRSSDSVYCSACRRWLEVNATQQQRVGPDLLHFCPQCGGQCTSDPMVPGDTRAEPEEITFVQGAAGAFGYPFRASGGWMLLCGAIALTLTEYAAALARFAFLFGLLALIILTIGVTGYLFAFIKDVLATSARGDDTMPGWPEVTSPADFGGPFLQFLALTIFCFGPLLGWSIWGPAFGGIWMPLALGVLGTFYFPMALVGVALADSIAGLNPAVILPSIVRIFGHYFLAWVLVAVLMAVQVGGGWLAQYVAIPFITTFSVEFVTLYLFVVTARVLGVMYYVHRRDLDWFREARR